MFKASKIKKILKSPQSRPFKRWLDHIEDFMERHRLFSSSGKGVLAFSGGVDSTALGVMLLALASRGRFKHLRFVWIDHGMRDQDIMSKEKKFILESLEELEQIVNSTYSESSFSENKFKFDFYLEEVANRPSDNNIEMYLREERYKILGQHCDAMGANCFLYTGHHIDDSFEWYLLQLSKSSSLEKSLGIPCLRGQIARPLMAYSKKQLESFLRLMNITAVEDHTNQNIHFERNWVRHQLAAVWMQKYPHVLKNYCSQMNRLNSLLISNQSGFDKQLNQIFSIQKVNWRHGVFIAYLRDKEIFKNSVKREELRDVLRKVIIKLSKSDRGKLRQSLEQFLGMGQSRKFGPATFSGGVIGHWSGGHIVCLMSSEANLNRLEELKRLDENLHSSLDSEVESFLRQTTRLNKKKFLNLLESSQIPVGCIFPFPVLGHSSHKVTKMIPQRGISLPKTYDRLRKRSDLGIICWGDLGELRVRWSKLSAKQKSYLLENTVFYLPNVLN